MNIKINIQKILELLRKLDAVDTNSLFSHYSSRYVWQQITKLEARRAGWRSKEEIISERKEQELKKFYNTLYFLKKQGLIEKTVSKAKLSFWKVTKQGVDKLSGLESLQKNRSPFLKPSHVKDHLKLVIFDIPENLKRHREWLRHTLINLGFAMLQKSVWIGEYKLPEDFVHSLRKLNILRCVHIFSVKDTGTLLRDIYSEF